MKVLRFSPNGTCRFIYGDDLADIARGIGPLVTRRASSVEPTYDGQWTADMIAGPCLGPYVTRQEALDSERDWLESNGTPFPKE